ncbi:hypothetical protein RB195_017682 [Necator americanus]|uniref:Phospholipase A2 n=1 Tax=Necator americanus TaxID=51031 RepID=A0ABR1C6A4_NECAM
MLRFYYAICCLVIALQFQRSSAITFGELFSGAIESIKNSSTVTKIRDWAAGLEQWSSTDWECGADRIWPTKLFSKAMAQKKCPTVLEQINSACRWHDICYSQGLEGQNACDTKFCDALHAINYSSEAEKKACDLPETMCDTVKLGGALIYRDKTQQ